jgi:3-methylcrotonyl-CoA carboxylase alpha subunit
VRLYAEDPARSFFPSTGVLARLRAPQDDVIRMDMGVEEGDEVSMFYDPMIGKIIAHAPTRTEALARLRGFLLGMEVVGPRTNLSFLAAVMGHEAFQAGDIDTGFIDRHLAALVPQKELTAPVVGAALIGHVLTRAKAASAAQAETLDPWSPWAASDNWVLGGQRSEVFKFSLDGEALAISTTPKDGAVQFEFAGGTHTVSGTLDDDGHIVAEVDGIRLKAGFATTTNGATLIHQGVNYVFDDIDPLDVDVAAEDGTGALVAPMPGKIVQVLAEAGAQVSRGAPIVVLEAMKMEQTLAAPADAVIASINVAAGDQVEAGTALVIFEEKADG